MKKQLYLKFESCHLLTLLRKALFASLFLLLATNVNAQLVPLYTFSQANGAYTPISGGTLVASATAASGVGSLDDNIYNVPNGTIPFTFSFNGTGYTGLNISTNGFITFGATAPSGTNYTPLSSTATYSGAVSVFGGDANALNNISGYNGDIRYETVGSSPNQEFVIQWTNFRPFSSSTSTTLYWRWNYQIRLHQDGSIRFVYDANFVGAVSSTTRQVGLRGANNTFATNVNNRLVTTGTHTWSTSVAGTSNSSTVGASTTNIPVSGLTYIFTPPQVCSSASGGTITPAAISKCVNQTYQMTATGATTGTGISYQWQVSLTPGGPYTPVSGGTGATTASYTTPALTAGVYYYVLTTTCANCGPCSGNSNELKLTVNTLPSVTVNPSSASICQPGASAVTLTAGGATTYAWSPAAGLSATSGSPVDALPSSNTTYIVTGTDNNGCTATAASLITVLQGVVISGINASPDNVCSGGTSVLTANASLSQNTYCTSTHTSGCSGDDITLVVLDNINNSTSGCGGVSHFTYFNGGGSQTTDLDATAGPYNLYVSVGSDGSQYVGAWIDYNHDGIYSSSEFLGASANAGSLGTATLSFSVLPGAYSGVTRMRIIGGNDNPVTSTQACGASSSPWGETQEYDVNITNGVDALSFAWTESPANGTLSSNSGNPVSANNITVSESYTVLATASNGCTATASKTVVSGAQLSCVSITATTSCELQPFSLTANTTGGGAPFHYTWDDGNGGVYSDASSIVASLPAGTYTFSVSVFDACGGSCSMNLSVTVDPVPGGVANGPASGYTGIANSYDVTGYSPGSTFQWQTATVSGGPYTNVSGPQSDIQSITFASTGSKFVRVITTGPTGCQSISNEIETVIGIYGDNVCGAISLSLGYNGPYTNVGATTEVGEPVPPLGSCTGQTAWCSGTVGISNTVWFTFVAPASGRVSIHFYPGQWDSEIALYSASDCNSILSGGATLLAANDDSSGSSPFNAYIAARCLILGETYYVQVDGYSTTTNESFGLLLLEESTDDGNACTVDNCDPATGVLTHVAVNIDDNNPCTDDACDTSTGISHIPTASGTPGASDGNACTLDACDGMGSTINSVIVCNDNNPCTDDFCNPASGCEYTNNNNIPYDDGNACTAGDACIDGVATSGSAVVCNDNNLCTDDSCNPATGCEYTNNNSTPYDDGNACTAGDACIDGVATSGSAVICDDNNLCTDDSCNPATGCEYTNNNNTPYDDGNACTAGDACVDGVATSGSAVVCNDNNLCTDDSCDPATGCVYTNNNSTPYDDGNACTAGDACIDGVATSGSAVVCNDNNLCTDDSCDPMTGCVYTNNNNTPYDDGNACTAGDACVDGVATSGSAVVCNDNNLCTDDSCDPATGCVYTNNNSTPYDDGNACTAGDACVDGVATSGSAVMCDDNNICTDDSCNPATGCEYTNNNNTPYDDGNACTAGDACVNGVATSGSAVVCNDNNLCTDDSCDPATGCVYTNNNSTPYDDGNACTAGDACIDGVATSGSAVMCDDNNVCTDDSCDPSSGCVYTNNNNNSYDDNNACTVGDACVDGVGTPGSPANTDDNNFCTTDGCDPINGVYNNPIPVTDNDPCTADGCVPSTGEITHVSTGLTATATAGTIACYNGTTNVQICATGGTAPYVLNTVSFNPCTNVTTGSGNGISWVVSDATGCEVQSNSVDIANPVKLEASCSATQTSGSGNTGSACASAMGGTIPYSYEWRNSSNAIVGTAACATGLGVGSYTVVVTDANGCTTSCTSTVTSSCVPPVTPGTISGLTPACGNTCVTYSIAAVANATGYQWVLPSGATGSSNGTSITVCFSTQFSGGYIRVRALGACGNSGYSSITIAKASSKPSKPSLISNSNGGNTYVCSSSTNTQVFCVSNDPNVSNYVWTIEGNGNPSLTILSGQGTNCVTVRIPAGYGGSQKLKVTPTNCKGSGSYQKISVKKATSAPSQPGSISGNSSECKSKSNSNYQVSSVSNTSSYNWTITGGASIVTGQGTNKIVVDFRTSTSSSVTICVTASNGCGTSSSRCKTVSVNLNCKIDANGNETISNTGSIEALIAYPNPTSGKATLAFTAASSAKYSVRVVDVIGRTMINETISAVEGYNTSDINLENVAKGMYFITVQTEGGEAQTLRLIVE